MELFFEILVAFANALTVAEFILMRWREYKDRKRMTKGDDT